MSAGHPAKPHSLAGKDARRPTIIHSALFPAPRPNPHHQHQQQPGNTEAAPPSSSAASVTSTRLESQRRCAGADASEGSTVSTSTAVIARRVAARWNDDRRDERPAGGSTTAAAPVKPYSRAEVICVLDAENRELRADLARSMGMLKLAQRTLQARSSENGVVARQIAESERLVREAYFIAEAHARAGLRHAMQAAIEVALAADRARTELEELHALELVSIGEEMKAETDELRRTIEMQRAQHAQEQLQLRRHLKPSRVSTDCGVQTKAVATRDASTSTTLVPQLQPTVTPRKVANAFVHCEDQIQVVIDAVDAFERRTEHISGRLTDPFGERNQRKGRNTAELAVQCEYDATAQAPRLSRTTQTIPLGFFKAEAAKDASVACTDGDLALVAVVSDAPTCGQWLIPVELHTPDTPRGGRTAASCGRTRHYASDGLCAHMLEVECFANKALPLLEALFVAACDALLHAAPPKVPPRQVDRSTWCTQPPLRIPLSTLHCRDNNQQQSLVPMTKEAEAAANAGLGRRRAEGRAPSPDPLLKRAAATGATAAAMGVAGDDDGGVSCMSEKFIDDYLNPSAELEKVQEQLDREERRAKLLRFELHRAESHLRASRHEAVTLRCRAAQLERLANAFSEDAAAAKNVLAELDRQLGQNDSVTATPSTPARAPTLRPTGGEAAHAAASPVTLLQQLATSDAIDLSNTTSVEEHKMGDDDDDAGAAAAAVTRLLARPAAELADIIVNERRQFRDALLEATNARVDDLLADAASHFTWIGSCGSWSAATKPREAAKAGSSLLDFECAVFALGQQSSYIAALGSSLRPAVEVLHDIYRHFVSPNRREPVQPGDSARPLSYFCVQQLQGVLRQLQTVCSELLKLTDLGACVGRGGKRKSGAGSTRDPYSRALLDCEVVQQHPNPPASPLQSVDAADVMTTDPLGELMGSPLASPPAASSNSLQRPSSDSAGSPPSPKSKVREHASSARVAAAKKTLQLATPASARRPPNPCYAQEAAGRVAQGTVRASKAAMRPGSASKRANTPPVATAAQRAAASSDVLLLSPTA